MPAQRRSGPPPTVHGHSLWIVTSALQKACRRGDEQTALRAVAELDRSGYTAHAWSRLATIAVEDVGLADPDAVVRVATLRDLADKARKRNKDSGQMELAFAALLLARAPKSRIVCHATIAAWGDPEPTPIADVAQDRHTAEGKRRGRGWDHFWSEAALLADVDTGALSHAPVLPDPYIACAMAVCRDGAGPIDETEPGQKSSGPSPTGPSESDDLQGEVRNLPTMHTLEPGQLRLDDEDAR